MVTGGTVCRQILTVYSDGMSKKLTVHVGEILHDQLVGAARRRGQSLHAWILVALSREAFRQLTAESAAWCAVHPDAIAEQVSVRAALVQGRGW